MLFKNSSVDRVIYIDNDIGLYNQPQKMLEQLKWHSFVLTPHLLSPLPLNQGDCQNELSLISFGTFNAGMFGTTKSSESISFLKWWGNWVLDPRHMIISYGYDQVWLNYVPVYCPNFFILREKNYNVAYWNLIERELNQRNGFFFLRMNH